VSTFGLAQIRSQLAALKARVDAGGGGIKGDTGDTGPAGPAGPQGLPGEIPVRAERLEGIGIWMGTSPPASPITYAQWVSGATGYWGWIYT
jgi:hypothetical protein